MAKPNILVIMTDEERYPPPYESDELATFRKERMPAREQLRAGGLEFHRHYTGATACLPSRTTMWTGQYPSLHGAAQTDGIAKNATDPAMNWLDPNSVPTMGDWFRAGGYQTHYRGKWHVSHADLLIPGTHRSLMASDDDGNLRPDAIEAYEKADRLDPYGFSGWIGREPHGIPKNNTGMVRDPVFAEQVAGLFGDIEQSDDTRPWLAVASFVNPHDIAFNGIGWTQVLGFDHPDLGIGSIAPAPSQADNFDGRPTCQAQFERLWHQMTFDQHADAQYRALYYHLHEVVDLAIARILAALDQAGLADDTIIVRTSDHGDMLGAHGGLMQKWYNAYDETIRVPLTITGPGIATDPAGIQTPTSHVDLLPTLLGLADIDVERATAGVSEHHTEVHDLPGRDLSGLVTGRATSADLAAPIYFMTEDDISRGLSQRNLITNEDYDPVDNPSKVESVIAELPTGPDGTGELWKLNHYYERLAEWNAAHGIKASIWATEPAEPFLELHNLTADPEERANVADSATEAKSQMLTILDTEREAKRLLPSLRNPSRN